jgi:hypothetical protein
MPWWSCRGGQRRTVNFVTRKWTAVLYSRPRWWLSKLELTCKKLLQHCAVMESGSIAAERAVRVSTVSPHSVKLAEVARQHRDSIHPFCCCYDRLTCIPSRCYIAVYQGGMRQFVMSAAQGVNFNIYLDPVRPQCPQCHLDCR